MFNNQSSDFYSDSGDDTSHIHEPKLSKKERWNEYMRNYRAKQKQKHQEAINNPQIPIMFNGCLKFCQCTDVQELLIRYVSILVSIYNKNSELFDEEITNQLNANQKDYIKFSKILVDAMERLIHLS